MIRASLSLRWRLGFNMSVGVLALLLLSLLGTYLILRANALQVGMAEQLAKQQRIARGLDDVFASVERRTEEFAAQIVGAKPNSQQLIAMMQSRVLKDPDTASLGVLLEAINPVRSDARFAVVSTYSSRGLQITDFVQTGYAYWTKDWYIYTLAQQNSWWSSPYFNDAAGGQDTVTLDHPLRDDKSQLFGMIGVSVTVDRVIERAMELGLDRGHDERHVMADANGRLLLIWDPALERAYTLEQAAQRTGSPALAWLTSATPEAAEQTVTVRNPKSGNEYLSFAEIPRVGWRIASIISEAQLLAPLHASLRRTLLLTLMWVVIVLPLLFVLARRVAEPLALLLARTEDMAQGRWQLTPGPPGRDDEIGRLALAVEHVGRRLAIESERANTASEAEHHSRAEWQQAAQSQRGLLPADRVFFGPRLQCELAGHVLKPLRVARCCYGFIAPSPGICSFYMASVSGGELAAALQMARLGTLLTSILRQGGGPGDSLRKVNEQWPNDGDVELRPQVLIGRIDLDTGHLSLASADHPAPLLLRTNNALHAADVSPGPAIGMSDRSDWQVWRSTLVGGDCLVMPSTGLTACHDDNDHSYVHQALPGILQRSGELPIRARMNAIIDDVQRHCSHSSPLGDLALLIATLRDRD